MKALFIINKSAIEHLVDNGTDETDAVVIGTTEGTEMVRLTNEQTPDTVPFVFTTSESVVNELKTKIWACFVTEM